MKLHHLADGHALLVVFGHLLGEEVHPIPLGEPLGKPGIELSRGQRNGNASLNMEGHHAVEEQVVLALGDDLGLAVLRDEDRKLLQVSADEVPDTFFGASLQFETVFKSAIRLVGGDDQVLLDSGAGHLLKEPCCLSRVRTSATTKPAACIAS